MYKMQGVKSGSPDSTITITSADDFVNIDPLWQPSEMDAAKLSLHQITVDPGDSTEGTIAVTATANGGATAETVYESDGTTPLTLDISSLETRKLEGYCLTNFVFNSSGMNGSEDWTVTVSSGKQ